jgi:hypothetical protein
MGIQRLCGWPMAAVAFWFHMLVGWRRVGNSVFEKAVDVAGAAMRVNLDMNASEISTEKSAKQRAIFLQKMVGAKLHHAL